MFSASVETISVRRRPSGIVTVGNYWTHEFNDVRSTALEYDLGPGDCMLCP